MTTYIRWTLSSIECYKRKCICGSDCSNHFICKKFTTKGLKPPIKYAVLSLISRYGIPNVKGTKNA